MQEGGSKRASGIPIVGGHASSAPPPHEPSVPPSASGIAERIPSVPPRHSSAAMRAGERKPLSLYPSIPAAGSREDLEDPMIGKVLLERVKIVRAIARGGMGKVYYAEQVAMGRPCAVKVLDLRMAGASNAEFTRRFLLEASVAAKLTHPNAVTIYDYGETDEGACFIAMEYLEGETLSDTLKREKRLSPERAVGIARQVCRALREAHALGVVHRDMKPGNIFLVRHDDEGDFAKVLDFGLVKETHSADDDAHTQVGQIMGSPRYMAPEQIEGKHVDARTDIYALGTVMYAMLTGHPPFERANEMATMMAHVSEKVVPISQAAPDVLLPQGLEALVMRCLEKDPARRFASMEEMLAALKLEPGAGLLALDSGQHVFASPALLYGVGGSLPVPAPPPASNTPRLLAVVLLAAAACAAILYITRMRAPVSAALPPVADSTTAPPPASAPPRPPESVATAVVHFDTEPEGARIKEDDAVVCESTPCDVEYRGAQADPTIEHLYVITKHGFDVEKKLAKVWASPITVKLSKGR